MPKRPRIFLSAASREFQGGESGLRVRSHLARLVDEAGCIPVAQEGFEARADAATVYQILSDHLASCSAIIHVCGFYFGAEPTSAGVGPRRSYTQLEYFLAKDMVRLRDRILVAIADETVFAPICPSQPEEHAQLQMAHRQYLLSRDNIYYTFRTPEDLDAPVKSFLQQLTAADRAASPISNVPYSTLGTLFKGREDFIQGIRTTLTGALDRAESARSNHESAHEPIVIHGLGGQGKTRVAVEYAERYKKHYDAILYVSAPTPDDLRRNLGGLCGVLRLRTQAMQLEIEEEQVQAALAWLENHTDWCLIIDGVDAPSAALAVDGLLTRLSAGHVVITSRLSNWSHRVIPLELDVLSKVAATEYILEATHAARNRTDADKADAEQLAGTLGQLALALQQASAYISRRRISIAAYRREWQSVGSRILAADPKLGDYHHCLTATWMVSTSRMTASARELLETLSWFSGEPMPRDLIENARLKDGSALLARDELVQFHFLDPAHNVDGDIMHGMVMQITRESLSQQRIPEVRYGARQVLHEQVDRCTREASHDATIERSSWDMLLPHVLAFLRRLEGTFDAENCEGIESATVRWLFRSGRWSVADALLASISERIVRSRGADHPSLAPILSNRAHILGQLGKTKEALPLAQRGLELTTYAYGTSDAATLRARTILEALTTAGGRTPDAISAFRTLLANAKSANSTSRLDLAMLHNNLAEALLNAGELSEAEREILEALHLLETSPQRQPDDESAILNNLASILQGQGRLAEAIASFEKARSILASHIGPDHPNVARIINNIGFTRRMMGDYTAAEAAYRDALRIKEKCFGVAGANLFPTLVNLGQVLKIQGKVEDASEVERRIAALER